MAGNEERINLKDSPKEESTGPHGGFSVVALQAGEKKEGQYDEESAETRSEFITSPVTE